MTTVRVARGRERVLTDAEPLPLPVAACLDVIARHRAAGEPLDRVAAAVARERHLGPRERRATADLAFSWARHKSAVEKLVDDAVAKERGMAPRRRVLDLCAVALAAVAGGSDVVDDRVKGALPEFLKALVDDALVEGLHLPTSLPPWLLARFERSFPGKGADVAKAVAGHAAPVLAVDVRAASVDAVVRALADAGVEAAPSALAPTAVRVTKGRLRLPKLPPAVRGAVWPMDDGSQAVAFALGAKAGERVLDLCAGGGGKSRLLAQSGAVVVSSDVDAGRLLRSLPKGVHGVVADGTAPPFQKASFDRVLVDAPCSGTGTLRRAPDLALRLEESELPALQALQKKLLSSALSLVKPGGTVVYATCSLLKDENEDVVDAVVKASAGVKRTAPDRHLLPPDSDGFYVATLTRA